MMPTEADLELDLSRTGREPFDLLSMHLHILYITIP